MFTKYISKKIVKKIDQSNPNKPTKLIAFIEAINLNYRKKKFYVVVILIRGILDYIPPIFNFDNTKTLIAQFKNTTFKKAIKFLDDSTRQLADDILHNPAHKNEILKVDKNSCDNIRENLLIVLDEVANQLNQKDFRESQNVRKKITKKIKSKTELEKFEQYIEDIDSWYQENLQENTLWIYKKDNLYQIHILNDHEDFSEPWTQVYPNSEGSGSYHVNLEYNKNHIKQFEFIYCDGGRINVIMPEIELDPSKNYWEGKDLYGASYKNVHYFWNKKDIGFKLMKLIGKFHIYKNLENIAKISKIEIR